MASQSPLPGETAAHPVRPVPPDRSVRTMAGRHSSAPGSELAAALRHSTGYDRCYDLFAARIYRYCWSLLGPGGSGSEPDRAAAALHETFLAAAQRIDALRDDREFAAWLFALARTAARRRGFSPRSPYAQLATAEAEQAAVHLSLRMAPSNRELLELYLRHGLPAPLIARVLGLDAETAAELCRTAVLRAADHLTRYALAPDHTDGLGPDRGVRAVLADFEPPGPPPALREQVLEDCASPLAAARRRAAAEAVDPLGSNGFPLHRNRKPGG
ncbi:RNA polymerase sigma factor, partial [Streptomonospora salina]